jgi:hypothetical protein
VRQGAHLVEVGADLLRHRDVALQEVGGAGDVAGFEGIDGARSTTSRGSTN